MLYWCTLLLFVVILTAVAGLGLFIRYGPEYGDTPTTLLEFEGEPDNPTPPSDRVQ